MTSRRALLAAVGLAGAGLLSGCGKAPGSAPGGSTVTEDPDNKAIETALREIMTDLQAGDFTAAQRRLCPDKEDAPTPEQLAQAFARFARPWRYTVVEVSYSPGRSGYVNTEVVDANQKKDRCSAQVEVQDGRWYVCELGPGRSSRSGVGGD